jgi:hypothetical protein
MKFIIITIVLLSFVLCFTSCAPGSGASTVEDPAGFFSGVWHGWIAPICLIWSIFDPSIRIYEPINSGWWYDFGFYIAIIGGFGSIALFRRKKKEKI